MRIEDLSSPLFLTPNAMAPRRTRATGPDIIDVRYAQLGQSVQSIALAPGSSVGDFRSAAGIEDNVQIKLNGTVLDDDHELTSGVTLFLNPKRVTGGAL